MTGGAGRPATRRRGQPVVALAMMLGGWVALRAAWWEPPQGLPSPPGLQAARSAAPNPAAPPAALPPAAAPPAASPPAASEAFAQLAAAQAALAPPLPTPPAALWPRPPQPRPDLAAPLLADPALRPAAPGDPLPAHMAAAHQLLWLAAVSDLPLPPGLMAPPTPLPAAAPQRFAPRALAAPAPAPALPPRARRWSADGWLLARRDTAGGVTAGGGLPAYGASQLGAVLRYRLAPGNAHRPTLYLRGTAALGGNSGALAEREGALGLALRPFAVLPLTVQAELRASHFAGGATRLRPALAVVSELAPLSLPARTRAEFYGAAGYVGGPAPTLFADGQLRIDRPLARLGGGELRLGGGLWGGAQAGSGRLDLGPGITLRFAQGEAAARLALDWRFRVAGNAAPGSGPALTLAAGF